MGFGGFTGSVAATPHPLGAIRLHPQSSVWRDGMTSTQLHVAQGGPPRRLFVLGLSGARPADLKVLAAGPLPADLAWRWPGAYAVVSEVAHETVIFTDPAAAQPVYIAPFGSGWAWSSSSRLLAGLNQAPVDTRRLVTAVFTPLLPALVGGRSFFDGVQQLPPGARIRLAPGTPPEITNLWLPRPDFGPELAGRLRGELEKAVGLGLGDSPFSTDLSGGLDSSSVTLLAAQQTPDNVRVPAVTVHPEGDESGADLRFARLVADSMPARIEHHLLPTKREHLPYTGITDVPAADEPAPSTMACAGLLRQLEWMAEQFDTRLHLTGDGGDSVCSQPPVHMADLARHRQFRAAFDQAAGWARLRHLPLSNILRQAVAAARISRADALTALAEQISQGSSLATGTVHWFAPIRLPAWAGTEALPLVRGEVERVAAAPDPLGGLDAGVRTVIDEVREVARTAQADAALAEDVGIQLRNPFLDASVVNTVLSVPLRSRPPVYAYKPQLVRAMGDLLPPPLAGRTTKGSFNADFYTGRRENLEALLGLADGFLAALGLVQPRALRRVLKQAAMGMPVPMGILDRTLAVEAWLLSLDREPEPRWVVAQEGEGRG
ncbi:albusnodin/ikarugamycin family macrolactam cyclase [Kitasatospora sp. MBT66]|uniref:albusnodin/ikarugamycin family macrolactam cyclase n=1 Tax=Kitasatospora sp. MBT66 TaxID=1444769 RepID=UPI0005BE1424|nr:albusnodin/ikarugamycin family macrolactam cyclase [Kitasatospora sp. MBT66]